MKKRISKLSIFFQKLEAVLLGSYYCYKKRMKETLTSIRYGGKIYDGKCTATGERFILSKEGSKKIH